MREYMYSPDVVRVALIVGVAISVTFYERIQLTTGGAIVPGYLAIALPRPLLVLMTLACGFTAYLAVGVLLPRYRIVYGRRKFELEILVGLALVTCGTVIAMVMGNTDHRWYALTGVGFLIPGLIAHDMGRQGPRKTMFAVLTTTAILAAFLMIYMTVLNALQARPAPPSVELASTVGYPLKLVIAAVIASVAMGMLLFALFGLRSGGFIAGAYLAMLQPRWQDLVFTLGCAVLTWFITTKLLMPRLLIFGRRKLAAMLLVSALVAWSGEMVFVSITDGDYVPLRGLAAITVMLPALLANDAQRQGLWRTFLGGGLSAVGVWVFVNLIAIPARTVGWL